MIPISGNHICPAGSVTRSMPPYSSGSQVVCGFVHFWKVKGMWGLGPTRRLKERDNWGGGGVILHLTTCEFTILFQVPRGTIRVETM